MRLGTFGAWFGPQHEDVARVGYVAEAERLGYGAAWIGLGQARVSDLRLFEEMLDATTHIVVASAIVNMWSNDPGPIAEAYHRIDTKHPDRFLLGVGIGHPETTSTYHNPYETIVSYLDALDAGGVPQERRILAALGPRVLRLARERTAGAHPYLVVPEHTRQAREILGTERILAPEQKVVMIDDPAVAREIGRPYIANPYLGLRNYVRNLRRVGFTEEDVANGGSDRLIDALCLHGDPESVARGLMAHIDAGADHVGVQVLTAPHQDPMADYETLAKVLLS
jgi:probable F420-dependent oxidoreductase